MISGLDEEKRKKADAVKKAAEAVKEANKERDIAKKAKKSETLLEDERDQLKLELEKLIRKATLKEEELKLKHGEEMKELQQQNAILSKQLLEASDVCKSLKSRNVALNEEVKELHENNSATIEYLEELGVSQGMSDETSFKHGFQTRKTLLVQLALGVPASLVTVTMQANGFKFPCNKIPAVDFVRKMRGELRNVVLALAATTIANPSVSYPPPSHICLLLFSSVFFFSMLVLCS
jgi:hypothetical protein